MYIFRQFATNVSLYPLLWDDEINNGLSLSNLISLCSHENNDIAAAVIQTLYELVDQVNFGFDFPCPSSLSIQPVRPACPSRRMFSVVRDHPVGGGNIWVNKILF